MVDLIICSWWADYKISLCFNDTFLLSLVRSRALLNERHGSCLFDVVPMQCAATFMGELIQLCSCLYFSLSLSLSLSLSFWLKKLFAANYCRCLCFGVSLARSFVRSLITLWLFKSVDRERLHSRVVCYSPSSS
jgi:hypothetical protein